MRNGYAIYTEVLTTYSQFNSNYILMKTNRKKIIQNILNIVEEKKLIICDKRFEKSNGGEFIRTTR